MEDHSPDFTDFLFNLKHELKTILFQFFEKFPEAKAYLNQQQLSPSQKTFDVCFLLNILASWNQLSDYFMDVPATRNRLHLAESLFHNETLQDSNLTWDEVKEKVECIIQLLHTFENESQIKLHCSSQIEKIESLWKTLPKKGKFVFLQETIKTQPKLPDLSFNTTATFLTPSSSSSTSASLLTTPSKLSFQEYVTQEIPVHTAISFYFRVQRHILMSEIDPSCQINDIMRCLEDKIILFGPKTEVENFKKKLLEKIEKITLLELDFELSDHFAQYYVKHPKVQQIIGTEAVLFFPFEKLSHSHPTSTHHTKQKKVSGILVGMNKEKLERIKQELMKLPIVTKERILTKDELKAFLEWQYEAKKMSISYHIYDIQGNVEQNEKDSENFYLTISKSTPQTSETCQFLEDEKKQPLKRITFEGFEEDVERAMKNLEEYLNKQIIETRKIFIEQYKWKFIRLHYPDLIPNLFSQHEVKFGFCESQELKSFSQETNLSASIYSTIENVEVSLCGRRENVNEVQDKIQKILSKVEMRIITLQFDNDLWFSIESKVPQLEQTWKVKLLLSKNENNDRIHIIVVGTKLSQQLIKQLESITITEESIPIPRPKIFRKLFSLIEEQKKHEEFQQKWGVKIDFDCVNQTITIRGIAEDIASAKDELKTLVNFQWTVKEIDFLHEYHPQILTSRFKTEIQKIEIDTQTQIRFKTFEKPLKITISGKPNNVATAEQKIQQLLNTISKQIVQVRIILTEEDINFLRREETEISKLSDKYFVVIKFPQQDNISLMECVTKQLPTGPTIEIKQGDITKERVDAIVNSANEKLEHYGGVALAIAQAGGPKLQIECQQYIAQYGKLPCGEAMYTSSGDIKACKYVIHCVSPVWQGGNFNEIQLLEKTMRRVLEVANQLQIQSLAIPAIGSGIYGIPLNLAASTYFKVIKSFFQANPNSSIKTLKFVDKNETMIKILKSTFEGNRMDPNLLDTKKETKVMSLPKTKYQWYWRDDYGQFVPYDPDQNEQIESAYLQGKEGVIFRDGNSFSNKLYQVIFKEMKQMNLLTKYKRDVKREPIRYASSSIISNVSLNPSVNSNDESVYTNTNTNLIPNQNTLTQNLIMIIGLKTDVENMKKEINKFLELKKCECVDPSDLISSTNSVSSFGKYSSSEQVLQQHQPNRNFMSTIPISQSSPRITSETEARFSSSLKEGIPLSQFRIGASLAKYEIPLSELKLEKQPIEEAAIEKVYKATYKEKTVVVKKFKLPSNLSQREGVQKIDMDFRNEIEILLSLNHPNIVKCIGACMEPPILCIVTEYCNGGSLYNILHKQKVKLSTQQQIEIALKIAEGMEYLHSFNPIVVHRDLKSHNILLNDGIPKISDFGLSETKGAISKLYDHQSRLFNWAAPEQMREDSKPHLSVDVWSFGMILYELTTNTIPYGYCKTPFQIYEEMVVKKKTPPIPEGIEIHPTLLNLMKQCWNWDPQQRPSFTQIVQTFKTALDRK